MSKAAPITASVLPSIVPAKKAHAAPLDPRILFSGICALALVVAILFSQRAAYGEQRQGVVDDGEPRRIAIPSGATS